MRLILVLAQLIFPLSFAQAAEFPQWVKKPPIEDDQYRFYIGRASGELSEAQLVEAAYQDAKNAAIAESFGITTQLSKQSYETLDSTTAISKMDEVSQKVVLVGFQKADQFISDDKLKQTWVLYKYPKTEIAKEQLRLASSSKTPSAEFSDVTGSSKKDAGILEIITNPVGANVTVDGQSYGLSPLRLRIEQGPHAVSIDHPYFQSTEEKVIATSGGSKKLNIILNRAARTVAIRTNPSGANITLAGKFIGQSPIETTVYAGDQLSLLITHPETQPLKTEIQIGKGSGVQEIELPDLILRPSFLSITSEPMGAEVFADGKSIGKAPTGFFQTKSVTVLLKKDGYSDSESFVALKGGERLVLPTIKLDPISSSEKYEAEKKKKKMARDPNWIVRGSIKGSGKTIDGQGYDSLAGYSFDVDRRFFSWVGIALSIEPYSRGQDSSKTVFTSSTVSGGLPIYFESFYLRPEYIARATNVTPTAGGDQSLNQTGYGVVVGNDFFKLKDDWGCGLSVNVGYHTYSSSGAFNGASALSGSVGLAFGW